MTLADSSAWIELLRATGSGVNERMRELVRTETVVGCDPVRLEILAGARSQRNLSELSGLLDRAMGLATGPEHYEEAAALYRQCRARGETVRKPMDCLIAAHAILADLPLLARDGDYDVLSRHTALRLA